MELQLIAALIASREAYSSVRQHLNLQDYSPITAVVIKAIDRWYESDKEAQHADLDLLRQDLLTRVKTEDHQEQINTLLDNSVEVDSSPANVARIVLESKKGITGYNLAQAILAKEDEDEVAALIDEYNDLRSRISLAESEEDEVLSSEDFMSTLDTAAGEFMIWPKSLGRRLGLASRGHHIVVSALPEIGKTALSVNMSCGLAHQGFTGLYFGNEEPIKMLQMRFVTNMSGMNRDEVLTTPDKAFSLARERGLDNITLASPVPCTYAKVRALVEKHRPDFVVMDQVRNMRVKAENRTNQLEAAAQAMREIAREFNCLVISVTQAADSARDKLYLDDGDIDSSNIGIPGACDAILLMGADDEYKKRGVRMVNLAKNKIGGDHEPIPVRVNAPLSRVLDME